MAEQISKYFDALIYEVNALAIPRAFKDDMIAQLGFLKIQSLCDYDRREPTAVLREVWKNVDRAMHQHGLYDRYQPSKKAWETIGLFVELGEFRPRVMKIEATSAVHSKYREFDVTRLFGALIQGCAVFSDEKERAKIKLTLKYLETESRKTRAKRDQSEIRLAWRRIHTDLKEHGVLRDFEQEPMKQRLLDFLKG